MLLSRLSLDFSEHGSCSRGERSSSDVVTRLSAQRLPAGSCGFDQVTALCVEILRSPEPKGKEALT